MHRRPPKRTRTGTLVPYTTLVRSTTLGRLPLARHRGSSRCAPQARTRSWPFGDDPHGGRDRVRGSRGQGAGAGRHVVCSVGRRSEEHTSELQSLMRISYAVFCLKKKNTKHELNIRKQLETKRDHE